MTWKTVFISILLAIIVTSCAPAPTLVAEPVITEAVIPTPIASTATAVPAVKIKQNDLTFLEFFAVT